MFYTKARDNWAVLSRFLSQESGDERFPERGETMLTNFYYVILVEPQKDANLRTPLDVQACLLRI